MKTDVLNKILHFLLYYIHFHVNNRDSQSTVVWETVVVGNGFTENPDLFNIQTVTLFSSTMKMRRYTFHHHQEVLVHRLVVFFNTEFRFIDEIGR